MAYLCVYEWFQCSFGVTHSYFSSMSTTVNLTTFQSSTLTVSLPPLPEGWRDDVVYMLHDFLEDAGLAQTLCALEQETG